MVLRIFRLSMLIFLAAVVLAGCRDRSQFAGELAQYDFRQTRDIVRRVKEAADLVHEKGPAAFDTLRTDPQYKDGEFYVYVYDTAGLNLFHGGDPSLEGKNLMDVRDVEGRRTLALALAAAKDPHNPHGWVHYQWKQPGRFYPVKKSSCHFLVSMPDGRTVLVGGGLTDPPVERAFVRFMVDSAADLLHKRGAAALDTLRDPSSAYTYHDRTLFVLGLDGRAIVDPVFLAETGIDYTDKTDEVGYACIHDMLEKLGREESAWVVIQTHHRLSKNLVKMAIYGHRTIMDGRRVVVGGIVELPKPAWSD